METATAFALGEANRGKEMKVFDWNKAAEFIVKRDIRDAGAGLKDDLEWTAGTILRDGKPVKDNACYLASTWAVPVLLDHGEQNGIQRGHNMAGIGIAASEMRGRNGRDIQHSEAVFI